MKRITAVLAVVCALVLGGCADGTEQLPKSDTGSSATEEPAVDSSDGRVLVELSSSSVDGTDIDVFARKLPDGRWVTCLVMGDYSKGGMSCDWANTTTERPAQ